MSPIGQKRTFKLGPLGEVLEQLFDLLWAPAVCMAVGLTYLRKMPASPMRSRTLAVVPCFGLALLYLAACLIAFSGIERPEFSLIFLGILVVLVIASVASIFLTKAGALHLLQFPNLLAAVWIFFLGSMMVTGNWL